MSASDRRPKKSREQREAAARLQRGPGVQVRGLKDKKLKSKLSHAERLYRESQQKAVKINEWLLPSEAGSLEAEGAKAAA